MSRLNEQLWIARDALITNDAMITFPSNVYLQRGIRLALRIVEDFLKYFEERGLEQHGRHFAIPRDAVKHFGYAVIGQRGIGGILTQHEAVSIDDSIVNKPVNNGPQLDIIRQFSMFLSVFQYGLNYQVINQGFHPIRWLQRLECGTVSNCSSQ